MNQLQQVRKPSGFNQAMGIEWECFIRHHLYNNIDEKGNHVDFFYLSDDGSLTGRPLGFSSAEFVSQPLTVPWLHRQLDKLSKRIGDTKVNESCGIHVHVSRNWLTNYRARLIARSLEEFLDGEMRYIFGRSPNNYCENRASMSGRYCQVNFCNAATIEFRGFASGDVYMAHYAVALTEFMVNNSKKWEKNLDLPAKISHEIKDMATVLKKHYNLTHF